MTSLPNREFKPRKRVLIPRDEQKRLDTLPKELIRKLTIEEAGPFWKICREGGGPIPPECFGLYTSRYKALESVHQYMHRANKV